MPIFLKFVPLLPFTALCFFTAGMRFTHEVTSEIAPAKPLRVRPCLTVMGSALPGGVAAADGTPVSLTVVSEGVGNRGTQLLHLSNGVTVLLLNASAGRVCVHQQIDVRLSGLPAPHHGNLPLTERRMALLEP